MVQIPRIDRVNAHHHKDIRGAKSPVDHRAFTKTRAKPHIALDERRQGFERAFYVKRVLLKPMHRHIVPGMRLHPPCLRHQRRVMKKRQSLGMLAWRNSFKTRATEHKLNPVMADIGKKPLPEQIDNPFAAIGLEDAGAAKLQHPRPGEGGQHGRKVIFPGGVEIRAMGRSNIAAQQAIGADNLRPNLAETADFPGMVDHDQMVADAVIGVDIAARDEGAGIRRRAHFLEEHLEAQALRPADILPRAREPHFQCADAPEALRHAATITHNIMPGGEPRHDTQGVERLRVRRFERCRNSLVGNHIDHARVPSRKQRCSLVWTL